MSTRRDTIKHSKVTYGFVGLFVSTILLYLYFLNMSVVHVVLRSEYIQQQQALSTDIALLESRYIEAQHTIASRIATLDGYNTNTPKIFVSREQALLVLASE